MGRRARLGRFFTPPDGFAVLDTLTARICRVLGASSACLMVYEATQEHLVVVSAQGVPIEKGEILEGASPIVRWLNESSAPLVVNDVGSTQVDRSFVLVPEAKAMLWMPVFLAGHVCGALAVFHSEKNALFGSDLDILDFISSQVASIIELYLRMDEVTITDFLTGLVAWPYFLERVKEESLRSERYGAPVSLVKVILKPADPSDTTLQRRIVPEAAECMKQVVRRSDIVARCGEWCFSIILPETGSEGAKAVLGKLEGEMHRLARDRMGAEADLGVETKFICYPESEPDREQFVSIATSEYA